MYLCVFSADLLTWAHHADLKTVPDAMLVKAIEAEQENAPEHTMLGPSIFEDDKSSGNLKEAPGHFQPVSFAMSCRVEFNREAEEHVALTKVRMWHCGVSTQWQTYALSPIARAWFCM